MASGALEGDGASSRGNRGGSGEAGLDVRGSGARTAAECFAAAALQLRLAPAFAAPCDLVDGFRQCTKRELLPKPRCSAPIELPDPKVQRLHGACSIGAQQAQGGLDHRDLRQSIARSPWKPSNAWPRSS